MFLYEEGEELKSVFLISDGSVKEYNSYYDKSHYFGDILGMPQMILGLPSRTACITNCTALVVKIPITTIMHQMDFNAISFLWKDQLYNIIQLYPEGFPGLINRPQEKIEDLFDEALIAEFLPDEQIPLLQGVIYLNGNIEFKQSSIIENSMQEKSLVMNQSKEANLNKKKDKKEASSLNPSILFKINEETVLKPPMLLISNEYIYTKTVSTFLLFNGRTKTLFDEMLGRKLQSIDPLIFRISGIQKLKSQLQKRNTKNIFLRESLLNKSIDNEMNQQQTKQINFKRLSQPLLAQNVLRWSGGAINLMKQTNQRYSNQDYEMLEELDILNKSDNDRQNLLKKKKD